LEYYEFLYVNRLKESVQHFFDLKIAAKRKKEEEFELKMERQSILADFFEGFDEPIKFKQTFNDVIQNKKQYTKNMKPVTRAYINRLEHTNSIILREKMDRLVGM
jgi:hypothetical protein